MKKYFTLIPIVLVALFIGVYSTINNNLNSDIKATHNNYLNSKLSINLKESHLDENIASQIIVIDDSDFEDSNFSFSSLYIDSHHDIKTTIPSLVTLKKVAHHDIDALPANQIEVFNLEVLNTIANVTSMNNIPDYWEIVYAIESSQGKLLYRKRNKARNCTWTTAPCGHHQLTVKALKDIGCTQLQCRKDRLNFSKSLEMSKKLLTLNEKRLAKNGYDRLQDYQRYLIHQQGATGLRIILAASEGKKLLTKSVKKNMANNSPFTYKSLRTMGDKRAANRFMSHWKNKWVEYGRQIVENQIPETIPLFDEKEIQLALNYRF